MKKLNNKAIEIAVSTFVTLILVLLIFSYSVYLLWNLYYGGEEIYQGIDAKTQSAIERMLFSENSIVAIPISRQEGKIGDKLVFGLGIRNILDEPKTNFQIKVDFSNAYDETTQKPIEGSNENYMTTKWLGSTKEFRETVKRFDKYKPMPLLVQVDSKIASDKKTLPGVYVFNVCVTKADKSITKCDSTQKDKTYDNKVHSISVVVK